jgi:hypothetical protein
MKDLGGDYAYVHCGGMIMQRHEMDLSMKMLAPSFLKICAVLDNAFFILELTFFVPYTATSQLCSAKPFKVIIIGDSCPTPHFEQLSRFHFACFTRHWSLYLLHIRVLVLRNRRVGELRIPVDIRCSWLI